MRTAKWNWVFRFFTGDNLEHWCYKSDRLRTRCCSTYSYIYGIKKKRRVSRFFAVVWFDQPPPLSPASYNRQTSPATQREERLRDMEEGAIVAVSGKRGRRGGDLTKKTTAKKRGPLPIYSLYFCTHARERSRSQNLSPEFSRLRA